MQNVKEQIEKSELLVGKLLGTLTPEQRQKLEDWEKLDDNLKNEANILNAESFKDWNERMDRLDTSDEWIRFVDNVEKVKSKSKVVKMKFFKAIVSIAAVFVIGFSVYFKYQQTVIEKSFQTVADVNIAPGSVHAKLVLSSGKEVDLEASGKDVIAEGNVDINNEKGVLLYNQDKEQKNSAPVINTLQIPRGGEYQLVLPDGTKVWLNSETQLTYSVPFSGKERRVKLKGEAYFEVAHDKAMPFVVETEKQDVEVLGTHFNISAYQNDLNVVTTLVEGKVRVEHIGNEQKKLESVLLPNDQLVLNNKTQAVYKHKVETELYTAWKDGRFVFNNESIEVFFKKLSRWYNVEVVIVDESIKKINFTGDLPRDKNMSDILKIVEAEMSVHIKIKDNKKIYVTR